MQMLESKNLHLHNEFYLNIAPWILGNVFAKKVIALQMFTNPLVGEKFHTMLLGDVASGKSDFLFFVSRCLKNGGYTGKYITGVGMVESLVSSEGAILSCDEFDKIETVHRNMMLEAMQHQTITIDTHDGHDTPSAKTNILAGANPRNDLLTTQPLYLQTNFSLAILTRFHILVPFYQIGKEHYKEIAINNNSMKNPEEINGLQLSIREYIHETKTKIPIVNIPSTISGNVGHFVEQLKMYSKIKRIISPRTIEGFISLIKARARMNFRSEVNMEDFDEVRALFNKGYMT